MSNDLPPQRPPELAKVFDDLCHAFDRDFQNGWNPRIEDFLSRVDETLRPRLFQELLEIEIALRIEAAKPTNRSPGAPSSEIPPLLDDPESEYRTRFPDYDKTVSEVIHRLVQSKHLGDYELLQEIGSGGMGVVYRAVQRYLNHLVAIKVLPQSASEDPSTVLRFRREMFLIGELNHPNVVRALYAGESNGLLYLVTELVTGTTLQALMEKSWKRFISDRLRIPEFQMPPQAACEVIRQAALGLEHIDQLGLVHRDVKPANLMIANNGVVKLFDLGLGKFDFGELTAAPTDSTLTRVGTMMGTLDYMAPEQWTDSAGVDIRADIYSLGCTLYFMLTHSTPYSGSDYATQRQKFLAHMSAPIPPLDEVLRGYPRQLARGIDAIYRRMMAKEPEDRFQSPQELADAIEPYADYHELMSFINNVFDLPAGSTSDPIPSGIIVTEKSVLPHQRKGFGFGFALGCWAGLLAAVLLLLLLR